MRYGSGAVLRGVSALAVAGLMAGALGCGGGSGSKNTTPPPASANSVALTVDGGPPGLTYNNGNVAFASLTVCVPGSTTQCQTIDHLLLDTGSSGIRVLASVLDPALLAALPQSTP